MCNQSRKESREIPLGELCALLTEFSSEKIIDLGTTILHVGTCVHQGRVILVNTICGRAACIVT